MVVLAARTTGVASKDQKPSLVCCRAGFGETGSANFAQTGKRVVSGLQPSTMIDRKCEISGGEGG